MKEKFSKLALSLGVATVAAAGVTFTPQAIAVGHNHGAKVKALEAQVNRMSEMMKSMQSELNRVRTEASRPDPKVQELEEWMQNAKSGPAISDSKDNMVFFRGGFAHNDHDRTGQILTDTAGGLGITPQSNGDQDAWYAGAGFDFSLSDDFFGIADGTEVLAELMFEYKHFDSRENQLNPLGTVVNTAVNNTPTGALGTVNVTQVSLTAAPKIKFFKGSKVRPWIIPAGLAIHIVSPPSNGVTVFNTGIMFGGGLDVHLWNNIYAGLDARYHLTTDHLDGVNTDGYTGGGYIGIGF